jgi:hypothetical protein
VTKRLRNLIAGFVQGVALAALTSAFVLTWLWLGRAPASPDPAHGLVVSRQLFGFGGFVSHAQADSLSTFLYGGMLAAMLARLIRPQIRWVTLGTRWGFGERFEVDDPERLARRTMPAGFVVGLIAAQALLP